MSLKHSNMGMIVFALAMVFSASVSAHSSADSFIMLNGSVVRCSDLQKQNDFINQKYARVELDKNSYSALDHTADVKVSIVSCNNGAWEIDRTPFSHSYIAYNGERVDVSYSDYELLVVDIEGDSSITHRSSLDLSKGVVVVSKILATSAGHSPQKELIVTAAKTVTTASGYLDTKRVSFGSFRLTFEN
jgi:hypothetical protein